MTFLNRLSVLTLGALLAAGAQSQVFFNFETDLHGFNSSGATLSQSTDGVTEGSYSMRVDWPGGFHWLFGGNAPGLVEALATHQVFLIDVSAPASGNPAPWANTMFSFNDPIGWRQNDSASPGLPLIPGTNTIAYDYRNMAAPDPNNSWFQFNIGINAGGGPNTVFFDNGRVLDENQTITIFSFEDDLHGFNSSGATISQDTIGATHGTHSMKVDWPGGFTWIGGGSGAGVAEAINEGIVLLMDLTVAEGGTPPPWANLVISFNDPIGWRQSGTSMGIPTRPGTYTVAVDYRALTLPDPNGPWFQLALGINGGSAHTFYVDNIRVLRAAAEPVPGDVNGDGCVDDADLAAVIFEFGSPESGSFGNTDLNDDGIVDDADLAEVIFNFGTGC